MNEDIFAGQWKQMRGELKSWWGKLADDELDLIGGHKDKLIGLVQERYGYAREHAEQEVERRFKEFSDKTAGAVANITAKAQEFGATAGNKANEAATVVGEKIGSLANVIRENAPHEGAVGNRGNSGSRWAGIGELLPAREKIRPSGQRCHGLSPHLSGPISADRYWSRLFAGPAPEISHGKRIATPLRAKFRIVARRHR